MTKEENANLSIFEVNKKECKDIPYLETMALNTWQEGQWKQLSESFMNRMEEQQEEETNIKQVFTTRHDKKGDQEEETKNKTNKIIGKLQKRKVNRRHALQQQQHQQPQQHENLGYNLSMNENNRQQQLHQWQQLQQLQRIQQQSQQQPINIHPQQMLMLSNQLLQYNQPTNPYQTLTGNVESIETMQQANHFIQYNQQQQTQQRAPQVLDLSTIQQQQIMSLLNINPMMTFPMSTPSTPHTMQQVPNLEHTMNRMDSTQQPHIDTRNPMMMGLGTDPSTKGSGIGSMIGGQDPTFTMDVKTKSNSVYNGGPYPRFVSNSHTYTMRITLSSTLPVVPPYFNKHHIRLVFVSSHGVILKKASEAIQLTNEPRFISMNYNMPQANPFSIKAVARMEIELKFLKTTKQLKFAEGVYFGLASYQDLQYIAHDNLSVRKKHKLKAIKTIGEPILLYKAPPSIKIYSRKD